MGHLRNHKLQENPPFLAYLSACSTGVNQASKPTDEVIHLVSAFQLADFRHVVGTLWEVLDQHCIAVARVLYKTIRDEGMTDMAIIRGLHQAVRALRDEEIEAVRDRRDVTVLDDLDDEVRKPDSKNYYWVPYIHPGI